MLKDLLFPDLSGNGDSRSASSPAEPDAAQNAGEALLSGINDQRFVSVADDDDIDISSFPAMRTALRLNGTEPETEEETPGQSDASENVSLEAAPSMPEPEDVEELIPSIFAGIGRTDWSTPPKQPEVETETDNDEEDAEAEKEPDEPEKDGEDIDEIDEFDLLDLIDEIEFADLDPEPMRPMKYASDSYDPYNTSFNSSLSGQPEDEPDEIAMSPKFKFE